MIGQRHADRYRTVKKNFLINPLDNNYGITSLATGLANVNPFTCMTAVASTPQQTFEELNAKCPCGATGGIYMIYMVFSLFTATIQFPYAYTGTTGFVHRLYGHAVTGSP